MIISVVIFQYYAQRHTISLRKSVDFLSCRRVSYTVVKDVVKDAGCSRRTRNALCELMSSALYDLSI